MPLIAVVSAKGAPGVTTLTVALAALTPGAVAADLDPDGGDLALRYRREDGAPLDLDQGLLSLAASLRRDPGDFVGAGPIDAHLQVAAGGLEVLLGVKGPDQAIGLGPLWSPLARALTESDRAVFADCGRVGPASPAMPVLLVADAVIVLARAEIDELAHLRERLRFLVATLPSRYSGRARVGVVLVAGERDRAAGPRTEQLLRASGVAVSVLGTIADDARGAMRLRGLSHGRVGRTTLVRSVRSLLPAVRALAGDVSDVAQLRSRARNGVEVPGSVRPPETRSAAQPPDHAPVLLSKDPPGSLPGGSPPGESPRPEPELETRSAPQPERPGESGLFPAEFNDPEFSESAFNGSEEFTEASLYTELASFGEPGHFTEVEPGAESFDQPEHQLEHQPEHQPEPGPDDESDQYFDPEQYLEPSDQYAELGRSEPEFDPADGSDPGLTRDAADPDSEFAEPPFPEPQFPDPLTGPYRAAPTGWPDPPDPPGPPDRHGPPDQHGPPNQQKRFNRPTRSDQHGTTGEIPATVSPNGGD
jgi:hypothetical protein